MPSARSLVRSAARILGRHPGFSLVVVLILAVAIAGNATLFGLVNAALLQPLPYGDPGRIVTADVLSTKGYYISTSIPNYRDWRDRSRVFETWGASSGWGWTLTGDGPAEVLGGQAVFGEFFDVLSLRAARGRVLSGEETEPGAEAVVILSHETWRNRFGGDPEIVGRVLSLDRRPHVIVGVLEPGAGYPSPETQAYVPMGSIPGLPFDVRDSSFGTRAFARMSPGVSLEEAQKDLDRVHREITELEGKPVDAPELRSLEEYLVGEAGDRLWLIFGAVVCVLAVALANVVNLFLVRNEARSHELAVRRTLGAGAWQLAATTIGESLLLASLGGVLGLALAAGASRVAGPVLARDLPSWALERFAVDWSVALFTAGLTLVVGLGAGVLAALRPAASPELANDLREGGVRGGSSRESRLRSVLVVGQVAAALVLVAAAALLMESLQSLRAVDLGFAPQGVLKARVPPSPEVSDDPDRWRGFYSEVESRLAALPGVDSAAASLLVPLEDRSWEMTIHPEGRDPEDDEAGESVLFGVVSTSYFETLGVPIVAGRGFGPSDREGAPPVAVIDETMAEKFWPGKDPLGQRLTVQEFDENGEAIYRTVVGVAANVRHYTVREPSRIQVYFPILQSGERTGMGLNVLVRSSLPPETLIEPLRAVVAEIDPGSPVYEARSLDSLVDEALAANRSLGTLVSAFAGFALLLAALGIFGLVSWMVTQRRREIGIRMALGADRRTLLGWITLRTLRLTAAGLVLGLVGAAFLGGLLESFLYDATPLSLPFLATPVAILTGTALVASLIPSGRAVRTDPTEVLRD